MSANKTQGRLTNTETRVLELIWEGMASKEIAHQLGCTKQSIARARARIHRKLAVTSTTQAVRRGLDLGYLTYRKA